MPPPQANQQPVGLKTLASKTEELSRQVDELKQANQKASDRVTELDTKITNILNG